MNTRSEVSLAVVGQMREAERFRERPRYVPVTGPISPKPHWHHLEAPIKLVI